MGTQPGSDGPGPPDPDQVHPATRAAWRRWLADHHATSPGVWVVSWKRHTGRPRPGYEALVEEALCFGWIDSQAKTVDADRSMQRFTPRRAGSVWVRSNKERVARLVAAGRMAPAGLAKVEAAKADGSWTAYEPVEAMEVPDDLAAALAADPDARFGWEALSRTARQQLLWGVISAKREETRARRIVAAVAAARERATS
ncbi:MAG: YdeI/OmpD-associated family protein [Acidimicrobiia bacterium]